MGLKKLKLYTVLLFLLALLVILLPSARHIQQVQENRNLLEKMEQRLDALGEEQLEQQRTVARWYNYNLDLGTPGLEAAYGRILNVENGAMAVLEVPELRVQLPIFHGEEGMVGHLPESHLPIGGRELHTVLTIQERYDWRVGMAVYIDCLGERTIYRVESVQVMSAGWPAEWPAEQERLTILHDRGRLRTIIRCVRCSELTVRKWEEMSYLSDAALAVILAFSLSIPACLRKRWKRRGFHGRKYHGFFRKNSRKSELL
jgi:sortase (surface protein transpeptidase)